LAILSILLLLTIALYKLNNMISNTVPIFKHVE